MGRNHARILSSLPEVKLVGVVDPVEIQGEHYGQFMRSTEELIAQGVDYCFVAVPTVMHEEVGMMLASSGIHALVEKPLATDPRGARILAEAFEAEGLIGAVGHIERYNPALQHARRKIESGDLGQIYQVITRRQGPFPSRIADVGVVKDLASHDIDLTAWITQQRFTSVAALTAHRAGRQHEDLVAIIGQLTNGVITSHTVNWLSPFKERQSVISGERGALVVDTLTADLTFYANGNVQSQWDGTALFRGVSEGDVVRYAISKPEPLRSEHEAFRDAILGRESNIVTMREAMATVAVAQAIIDSAERGQTVTLQEP